MCSYRGQPSSQQHTCLQISKHQSGETGRDGKEKREGEREEGEGDGRAIGRTEAAKEVDMREDGQGRRVSLL